MKNFFPKDPHDQKWLLVSGLMLALATSMSLNPNTINLARNEKPMNQFQFASETARVKDVEVAVSVSEGKPVMKTYKLTELPDKTVAVMELDKDKNGISSTSKILSKSFDDNEAILKALTAPVAETKPEEKKPEAKPDEKKEVAQEEKPSDVQLLTTNLEKLTASCDSRGTSDDSGCRVSVSRIDVLDCMSTAISTFMGNSKYTPKDKAQVVNKYYNDKIKVAISEEIKAIKDMSCFKSKSYIKDLGSLSEEFDLHNPEELLEAKTNKQKELSEKISNLMVSLGASVEVTSTRNALAQQAFQCDATITVVGRTAQKYGNDLSLNLLDMKFDFQTGRMENLKPWDPMDNNQFWTEYYAADRAARFMTNFGAGYANSLNPISINERMLQLQRELRDADGFSDLKGAQQRRLLYSAGANYKNPLQSWLNKTLNFDVNADMDFSNFSLDSSSRGFDPLSPDQIKARSTSASRGQWFERPMATRDSLPSRAEKETSSYQERQFRDLDRRFSRTRSSDRN